MNANDKKRAGCRGCPHYVTSTKYQIGGCSGVGFPQDLRNIHTCPRKLPGYKAPAQKTASP